MILVMGLYVLKYIKNSKINNKIPTLFDTKLDLRHEQIIPKKNTEEIMRISEAIASLLIVRK